MQKYCELIYEKVPGKKEAGGELGIDYMVVLTDMKMCFLPRLAEEFAKSMLLFVEAKGWESRPFVVHVSFRKKAKLKHLWLKQPTLQLTPITSSFLFSDAQTFSEAGLLLCTNLLRLGGDGNDGSCDGEHKWVKGHCQGLISDSAPGAFDMESGMRAIWNHKALQLPM